MSVGWVVSKFQREDGADITSSRKASICPCTATTPPLQHSFYKQLEVLHAVHMFD